MNETSNDTTIDIYVSGICFHLKRSIVMKIPYFHNSLASCIDLKEEIHVNRSSIGFQHVLAFMSDQKYPFPIEFAHELAFYGFDYDETKLYKSQTVVLKELDTVNKELGTNKYRLHVLYNAVQNIGFETRRVKWKCHKDGCNLPWSDGYKLCGKHKKMCIVPDCVTITADRSNYCDTHKESDSLICSVYRCHNYKVDGYKKCYIHCKWV